jgi:homoserine O-acetyltransferase
MKDESMTDSLKPTREGDFTFAHDEPFLLSGGDILQPVTQHYALYGTLSPARDNVILVCHALSGSACVADWWPELFGADRPFDTERYCILGINVLGSCYGSTGPKSIHPRTDRPYGGDFPVVSILDMVRAQTKVLDHLGIDRLHAVVGGSIGGMQALAWATDYPHRVARCIAIGAAPLSAMGLALSHLQREAIRQDPAWRGGHYSPDEPPARGLAMARALAMCSYKSADLFEDRYGRKPNRSGEAPDRSHEGRFDVGGYLDYQGKIFVNRFDANSYLAVTRAMDTFDLGRTPAEEMAALRRIRARVLMVGISSDWLFPAADVQALNERMIAAGVDVRYAELVSNHGHDAFLADAADLVPILVDTLHTERVPVAR